MNGCAGSMLLWLSSLVVYAASGTGLSPSRRQAVFGNLFHRLGNFIAGGFLKVMFKLFKPVAMFLMLYIFFAFSQPAAATTVLEAYEKLKQQPEYGRFVDQLVNTGKVTEGEISAFVRELSDRLEGKITEDNFDSQFRSAAISLILEERYEHVLDACAQAFAADWELIRKGELPSSLTGVRDALKRELFGENRGTSGGGGGGGGGQPPATSQPGETEPANPSTEQNPAQPPAPVQPGSPGMPEPQAGPVKTFTDIAGHWAQKDIEFMASRGLVSGVGNGRFAPDDTVTRAEFTAILARMMSLSGNPGAAERFSDIPPGAWYRDMVGAAAAAGLVAGTGGNTFDPGAPITREQMAAMLLRVLQHKNLANMQMTDAEVKGILATFNDNAAISTWARYAVAVVCRQGLMKGRQAAVFAPAGHSTRAEAAVVLRRVLDKQV